MDSTLALASATKVAPVPWSLPSSSSTALTHARRPGSSSGGTATPGNSFDHCCLATPYISRSTRSASASAVRINSSAVSPASSSSASLAANLALPSRQSPADLGRSSFSKNAW